MAIRLLDLQLIYGVDGARDQFEKLCAQLIRSKFPNAKSIRVKQGDGGIDIYVEEWEEVGKIHVFQVKFFPTGLGNDQKAQVRKSLKRCLANKRFTTVKWTLCLPIDLSLDETTWFDNWKQNAGGDALTRDNIDCWGETALSELLFKPENRGIKEAFFKEEHLTQIREMHEMLRNLLDDINIRITESVQEAFRQQGTSIPVFQTAEQFYQPFLNPDHLFHHTLPLIGRINQLKALTEFSNSSEQIALLPGPDGIGKSRLLLEALRQIEKDRKDLKVIMLCSTYIATNDSVLPEEQILMGVDDALTHDMNSLDELFRMVRTRQDRIKLVLAIRQEDLHEVKRHLIVLANFQPEEILELPPLQKVENPIELARAILGKEDLQHISQLVALASDSPLIMVIAGELLKRGKINNFILALSHDDFRREVLLRYKQALPNNTTFPLPLNKVQRVRELLYALGPFDTNNTVLAVKASTFLQITIEQFLETLELLEKVGMVICRGASYSNVPDALAYPLLEQACFFDSGKVKEFGSNIALEFTEPWQTSALKRLAEVDWLKGKGHETGLLTRFWQQQNHRFRFGSGAERIKILQIINDVAELQPKVALDFIQLALQLPHPTLPDVGNDQSLSEEIKLYLPGILGQIAQHVDFIKVAINLLWDLGKEDFHNISRSNDHPHQILKNLSKQRYGRFVTYYDMYLQCIEIWCNEAGAFSRDFTPLDLIPNFLTRDGYEDYYFSQTQSIHMQPFYVLPEPMKDVRKRAICLLSSIGQMDDKPKLQYHAVEVLRNIVIRGLMYHSTPELREQWYEEDRTILNEIVNIVRKTKSSFITYSVEYGIRIALKHPDNIPLTEDLRAVLTALPIDLDTKVIWYLKHGKSAEQFSETQTGKQEKSDNETAREVIERILQIYSTAPKLKRKLEELHAHLALYEQQIVYSRFLELLSEINPELGCELCRLLVEDPSSYAMDYFTYLVTPVRKWNPPTFLELVQQALKSGTPNLRRGAAYAICIYTDLENDESDIIIPLIKDIDPVIAMRAINAIHQLPEKKRDTAFSLLNDISISPQGMMLVDAICGALRQRMSNPSWDPTPSLIVFLQKCVSLPELSEQKHYSLCSLLLECRWQYPQIIANFYLDRVQYRRSLSEEEQMRYEPVSRFSSLPALLGRPVDEQHVDQRYNVLCRIRDELLEYQEEEIITIFTSFANGYDAVALQVISEWLEIDEEQKIRLIARLIREAPTAFVFDNEEFVNRLFSMRSLKNTNIREQIDIALLSSAMPFNVVGIPDMLSNERVQVRDKSQRVAAKYPPNSVMYEFYSKLNKEAENRIETQRSFLATQDILS